MAAVSRLSALRARHAGGAPRRELARIRPLAIVALGATAAQALLGPSFRITRVLRAPLEEERRRTREEVVADLRTTAQHVAHLSRGTREEARATPRP